MLMKMEKTEHRLSYFAPEIVHIVHLPGLVMWKMCIKSSSNALIYYLFFRFDRSLSF